METLIYIPVIEAVKSYCAVKCEKLANNRFRILNSSKFDIEDRTILYKFVPGDIVEVSLEELTNYNGSIQKIPVAIKLVDEHPKDRRLGALEYLIAAQEGLLTDQQKQDYIYAIEELKAKISLNEPNIDFHPAILRWYKSNFN